MVFDGAPPARTSANTETFVSFSVLPRFESFLATALRSIMNFISKSDSAVFVSAPPTLSKIDGIPLIKASTRIAEADNSAFSGRTVLCVGGRILLYPAYRQIVEDAGGKFLSFHSGADMSLIDLHKLLQNTDMVICSIDCIRHEAYFVTKRYCEHFSKPCVILDRSRITTFYNGIRMLKNFQ
ncbi:hypothetical protein SAMN05216302_100120 [Nitrosomonas aestuarii]|uniref:DUF2325 domain-containing protein n=2 Tax=Nitrosomonas aestuarii TaxID=52441 RepID=A0A1I3WZ43_9PROT|nr:uncharacterized protein DUF2325 [Nitrosomonas aestuarii]SFK12147.1 hypothetical protein SAMN05216302_100120 [Nitrosomonas aestuarii]